MNIYELKEKIDMYIAKGCKGGVLLYDEETKRILDLCNVEYMYDLVEANTEGVVILAKEFTIHNNSKDYSVCIFDKRKDYDSKAIVDVGQYIKLDLWGGESITLPITKVEVRDNKDIHITFSVPDLLYDDFKDNGEKDFYDIHFDYVKINGEINNEWEW